MYNVIVVGSTKLHSFSNLTHKQARQVANTYGSINLPVWVQKRGKVGFWL